MLNQCLPRCACAAIVVWLVVSSSMWHRPLLLALHCMSIASVVQSGNVIVWDRHLVMEELQAGRDALVRAPTGSGKTLAYLAPIVHDLQVRPCCSCQQIDES